MWRRLQIAFKIVLIIDMLQTSGFVKRIMIIRGEQVCWPIDMRAGWGSRQEFPVLPITGVVLFHSELPAFNQSVVSIN
jgi:hypothetical protein